MEIQLTIVNNFIFSLDSDEERVMHSKSVNIEIMINDEADDVIEELFDSLKNRYQNNLELMEGSGFVFDYVQLFCYKCYNFLDWIKNQNATINSINKKYNKCFQYAVTVTLNYEEIRKDPRRITKIKPFKINIIRKE